MEIVNGVPCFNCTDVERAKKLGTGGAAASDLLHPSTTLHLNSDNAPAGVVKPVEPTERGTNRPLPSGDRGTVLNLDI